GRMAVARTQQMMGTDVIWLLLHRAEFAEQFLTFGRVGVVDLVVADVIPVVRQFAQPLSRIDTDTDSFGHTVYHAKASGASPFCRGRPRLMSNRSSSRAMISGSSFSSEARSNPSRCASVRGPTIADDTAGFASTHAIATTCSGSPISRHSAENSSNCWLPTRIPYSFSTCCVRKPASDCFFPVSRPPASGM